MITFHLHPAAREQQLVQPFMAAVNGCRSVLEILVIRGLTGPVCNLVGEQGQSGSCKLALHLAGLVTELAHRARK